MSPDSGLGSHPGVPLYLVSWICLRAVALLSGHRDAVTYVLAQPDGFYLAIRAAAGCITLTSVLAAYRVLAPLDPWKRAIAIFSFFAIDYWSFIYGLTSLGNETFALPSAVLFFWCVNKVASRSRPSWLPWVYVGCAAGVAYLIKPPYLSILAGSLALACTASALYEGPVRSKFKLLCKLVLIVVGSFAALWSAVLLVVDGPAELAGLIKIHANLVWHNAVVGGNSGHSLSTALGFLLATNLPFAMIAAAVALAYVTYARWRSRTSDERSWLWCAAALASSGFASLAILSQFRSVYYVPAVTCFLPFLLKPVLERRFLAAVATIALLAASDSTARAVIGSLTNHISYIDRVKADEATIDAMPLDNGEARLWTYGASGKVPVKEFILQMAGLQAYVHERETGPSTDISTYAHVVRPYRYIIFGRSESLMQILRDSTKHSQLVQPSGMAITISNGAIIRQLGETIVVENPKADSKN